MKINKEATIVDQNLKIVRLGQVVRKLYAGVQQQLTDGVAERKYAGV